MYCPSISVNGLYSPSTNLYLGISLLPTVSYKMSVLKSLP